MQVFDVIIVGGGSDHCAPFVGAKPETSHSFLPGVIECYQSLKPCRRLT